MYVLKYLFEFLVYQNKSQYDYFYCKEKFAAISSAIELLIMYYIYSWIQTLPQCSLFYFIHSQKWWMIAQLTVMEMENAYLGTVTASQDF